jgi:hypothetical protein
MSKEFSFFLKGLLWLVFFALWACDFAQDCPDSADCTQDHYQRSDLSQNDDDDDDDDELICGEAMTCCQGQWYGNTCCGADGGQPMGDCSGDDDDDDDDSSSVLGCPPAQGSDGPCGQAIVWAKNPNDNSCCNYGDLCSAPDAWEVFYDESECLED